MTAWCLLALIVGVAHASLTGALLTLTLSASIIPHDSQLARQVIERLHTRGLMELIVLNVRLDLHVLSPTMFAMMILVALGTTLVTTPLVDYLTPRARLLGQR